MSNKYCQELVELRNKPAHELKEVGDQWRTPDNIFWGINTLFGPFVLDLFTDGDNAKCAAYYTAEDNALAHDWSERLAELKGAAFGNPPYSRASQHEGQYITGMRYIMKHASAMRDKGGRYVFLIKAATSEVWWPEDADHIAFIRGRIGFELPAWFIPKDEKLNFKSFTSSVLSDMAKILAQATMMKSIKGIGSVLGFDLSSLSLNANGGIYQSADLSRYSGTVVNRPTFFAFAKGAGVMGEAGPEAILPLRRGADGKLGVVADIGGSGMAMFSPQYNIEINNDGTNGQIGPAALKAVYDLGKKAAADFMQQQARDGGRLTDNKGKTHDVLTGSDDGRHSNTSLAWGAGVQVNPTESVAIDIAYEGSGSGDWRTDGFIVGVGYKF